MRRSDRSRRIVVPALSGFLLVFSLMLLYLGECFLLPRVALPHGGSAEQFGYDERQVAKRSPRDESTAAEIAGDATPLPMEIPTPGDSPREHAASTRPAPLIDPRTQLFVYLLNRARHDPGLYEAEASLQVDLSSVEPRPPLAISSTLTSASQFRAAEMAEHDYFEHRSDVTQDWPNRIVRRYGYELPDFYPEDENQIESIAAGASSASETLRQLILDEGVPSAGHRMHLLGIGDFCSQFREIGVGYAHSQQAQYGHYWAVHAARRQDDIRFLTGVVFGDRDADGRYGLEEGLADVTISTGAKMTRSNSAGGWSLEVEPGSLRDHR